MKRENGVGGNVKMTLAMLAAPAFARFEKIGVMANTAQCGQQTSRMLLGLPQRFALSR